MSVRPITKIKSIVCIAAAVFVLAGIAAAQGQPTKKQRRQAEDLWKAGDKSFQQKNYRNAIDQYAQSVAIVAENADVHAKKANAHFLLQEYDRAAAEATTALGQRFSKPIELYKMRALARYELHDLDGPVGASSDAGCEACADEAPCSEGQTSRTKGERCQGASPGVVPAHGERQRRSLPSRIRRNGQSSLLGSDRRPRVMLWA